MRETYFLASSAFALPLPLVLAFFSPLAFFSTLAVLSFFASVLAGALGAVSDLGACANAVNANAEAINATSSFFIAGSCLQKYDPMRICLLQRADLSAG